MNPIGHFFGTDGGSFYNFYSGFGGAVGSITLLGGVMTFWNHRKCHVKGCHHLGKLKVYDSDWTVCMKHHPNGHATPEKIAEHHAARLAAEHGKYSADDATK